MVGAEPIEIPHPRIVVESEQLKHGSWVFAARRRESPAGVRSRGPRDRSRIVAAADRVIAHRIFFEGEQRVIGPLGLGPEREAENRRQPGNAAEFAAHDERLGVAFGAGSKQAVPVGCPEDVEALAQLDRPAQRISLAAMEQRLAKSDSARRNATRSLSSVNSPKLEWVRCWSSSSPPRRSIDARRERATGIVASNGQSATSSGD